MGALTVTFLQPPPGLSAVTNRDKGDVMVPFLTPCLCSCCGNHSTAASGWAQGRSQSWTMRVLLRPCRVLTLTELFPDVLSSNQPIPMPCHWLSCSWAVSGPSLHLALGGKQELCGRRGLFPQQPLDPLCHQSPHVPRAEGDWHSTRAWKMTGSVSRP